MTLIQSSDPDFRICELDFDTLIELQQEAEERGWGTRWTSVDAVSYTHLDVYKRQSEGRPADGVYFGPFCVILR